MCRCRRILTDIKNATANRDLSAFLVFVFCNFTFHRLRFPLEHLQLFRISINVFGSEMIGNNHLIKPLG